MDPPLLICIKKLIRPKKTTPLIARFIQNILLAWTLYIFYRDLHKLSIPLSGWCTALTTAGWCCYSNVGAGACRRAPWWYYNTWCYINVYAGAYHRAALRAHSTAGASYWSPHSRRNDMLLGSSSITLPKPKAKCSICGKVVTKSNIRRHMRIHAGLNERKDTTNHRTQCVGDGVCLVQKSLPSTPVHVVQTAICSICSVKECEATKAAAQRGTQSYVCEHNRAT